MTTEMSASWGWNILSKVNHKQSQIKSNVEEFKKLKIFSEISPETFYTLKSTV